MSTFLIILSGLKISGCFNGMGVSEVGLWISTLFCIHSHDLGHNLAFHAAVATVR